MVTALLLAALSVVGWSLWTRRHTWSCRWETAGNRSMVFQAVGLICTAPGFVALGEWLHGITGRWNADDFIGHCFFIAAAGSTVHHALTRMEDQTKFGRHVVGVIAAAFVVRLGLFAKSQGSYTYTEDYLAMPEGVYTRLYWLVTCLTVIYLLLYMARLMMVLRRNPRHTRLANVYLFGAGVGVVTCLAKILSATTTSASMQMPLAIWLGCCVGAAGFSFGYGYSWRVRTRQFVRS